MAIELDIDQRVQQLVQPVGDWVALFVYGEPDPPEVWTEPVVAWALCEDLATGDQWSTALVIAGRNAPEPAAEKSEFFVGYVRAGGIENEDVQARIEHIIARQRASAA